MNAKLFPTFFAFPGTSLSLKERKIKQLELSLDSMWRFGGKNVSSNEVSVINEVSMYWNFAINEAILMY